MIDIDKDEELKKIFSINARQFPAASANFKFASQVQEDFYRNHLQFCPWLDGIHTMLVDSKSLIANQFASTILTNFLKSTGRLTVDINWLSAQNWDWDHKHLSGKGSIAVVTGCNRNPSSLNILSQFMEIYRNNAKIIIFKGEEPALDFFQENFCPVDTYFSIIPADKGIKKPNRTKKRTKI